MRRTMARSWRKCWPRLRSGRMPSASSSSVGVDISLPDLDALTRNDLADTPQSAAGCSERFLKLGAGCRVDCKEQAPRRLRVVEQICDSVRHALVDADPAL